MENDAAGVRGAERAKVDCGGRAIERRRRIFRRRRRCHQASVFDHWLHMTVKIAATLVRLVSMMAGGAVL